MYVIYIHLTLLDLYIYVDARRDISDLSVFVTLLHDDIPTAVYDGQALLTHDIWVPNMLRRCSEFVLPDSVTDLKTSFRLVITDPYQTVMHPDVFSDYDATHLLACNHP